MEKAHIVLFPILILIITGCSSQYLTDNTPKSEFERPIQKDAFPDKALEILSDALPDVTDFKYFQESDGRNLTYEAKLTIYGKDLSIEFDASSSLQDVEVLTDFESLTSTTNNAIKDYIESIYQSYRVTRVQYQYSSSTKSAIEIIQQAVKGNATEIDLRIEMEIEGKNRRQIGFFEYLFDSNGNLIQSRRIIKRSLDNIW